MTTVRTSADQKFTPDRQPPQPWLQHFGQAKGPTVITCFCDFVRRPARHATG